MMFRRKKPNWFITVIPGVRMLVAHSPNAPREEVERVQSEVAAFRKAKDGDTIQAGPELSEALGIGENL